MTVAVANLRRDQRASVLIDKPDHPYQGVHLNGTRTTIRFLPATTLTWDFGKLS